MLFKQEEALAFLGKHGLPSLTAYQPEALAFTNWFASMLGEDAMKFYCDQYKVPRISKDQLSVFCMVVGLLRTQEQRMITTLANSYCPPKHSILCRDLGGNLWNCSSDCEIARQSK